MEGDEGGVEGVGGRCSGIAEAKGWHGGGKPAKPGKATEGRDLRGLQEE